MANILETTLMRFKDLIQTAEKVSVPVKVKGRRRPGRNDQVNPHLITMLRSPTTVEITTAPLCKMDRPLLKDDLAPTKGVILAMVLSAPFWVIISALVWIVLR